MRKIGLLILCLLLCGCTVSESHIKQRVDSVIELVSSEKPIEETNMRKDYYDYFLPRNVGRRFSEQENSVFLLDNQTFYMNLDIAEVIISEYYDPMLSYQQKRYNEIMKIGTTMLSRNGELLNSSGEMRKYKVLLTRVETDNYFLFVQYGDVYFAALTPLASVEGLIYEMFKIGRSVRVDTDKVLATYSNKEVVIITKQYDLFEKVFPENGVVYDVLNPSKGDEGSHDDDVNYNVDEDLSIEEDATEEEQTKKD